MAKNISVFGLRWAETGETGAIGYVGLWRLRDSTGKALPEKEQVAQETYPIVLPEDWDIPDGMAGRLFWYGLKQKLADSVSDVPMGPEKLNGIRDTLQNLCAGVWGAAGGSGGPGISVLAEAVANLKGITIPEAQAAIKALTDDKRKALESGAKVQAEMAKVRESRKASPVAALDDLL